MDDADRILQILVEEANEKRLEWCDMLLIAIKTKDWNAIRALKLEMELHIFSE